MGRRKTVNFLVCKTRNREQWINASRLSEKADVQLQSDSAGKQQNLSRKITINKKKLEVLKRSEGLEIP